MPVLRSVGQATLAGKPASEFKSLFGKRFGVKQLAKGMMQGL